MVYLYLGPLTRRVGADQLSDAALCRRGAAASQRARQVSGNEPKGHRALSWVALLNQGATT